MAAAKTAPSKGRKARNPAPGGGSGGLELTTPDLVVLSYLVAGARHGHELDRVLVQHDVRDWAGISRPQVYYSLRKLARAGMIRAVARERGKAGPDRTVYGATPEGKVALAGALERADWAHQRTPPAFLTWMALSIHARPGMLRQQIARRREFLRAELRREIATLDAIQSAPDSQATRNALRMVDLTIRQFEVELNWLDDVEREAAGE
ncbi:MAG TPA: PadR family transcriptional regulator [Candidatus Acidoferrales bacterium]